jgi:simple sugar transport system substrate-binding protein
MTKKPSLLPIFLCSLLTVLCSLFSACTQNTEERTDSVSAATGKKGPPTRIMLKSIMPEAAADDVVKIAVLVNLRAGDISRLFIDGCVSEGRSMGFTVDAFVSGGDERRCREIAGGIARADYDGVIFVHGNEGFSYDILKPIADAGKQIVTFEALPYRDGRSIKGLVTTFQDDYSLARLSLETLIASTQTDYAPPDRLTSVIRIGCDPGLTFLDRRSWVFDEFVHSGEIAEAAFVKLDSLENSYSAAWEALAEILPLFPPGTVDAVWVPWNGFAGGCAEALAAAGRQDIKVFSIGISNDDILQMLRHPDIWLANAAVDPKLAGTVTMRLLAAVLAGESTVDTFSFSPQLVRAADLNYGIHAGNLSVMLPDWGDGTGLFDQYQWMIDLKSAEGRYLRISPTAAEHAEHVLHADHAEHADTSSAAP